MEATASNPISRPDLSAAQGRAHNQDFNFTAQHYLLNRTPEFLLYLYNVSEQTFTVSRPPIIREMKIPGRKAGERYALATHLPQPLLTPKGNVDSNEVDILALDTRRFLTDVINPDNLGINQDAHVAMKERTSQGNDLGQKGVFWSFNNPPLEEEVDRAYQRMEQYYQFLIEQATTVEVSAPATLKDVLTPEHHAACDYFGEEHSWHAKRSRPMDCPNCGEKIKAGSAFHKTDEGVLCIINWERAIKAGVRTRKQAIEAEIPGFTEKPVVPVAPVTEL